MLDEKKLKEIEKRITYYVQQDIIQKVKDREFMNFFLMNARISLNTAKLLFKISNDTKLKKKLEFPNFNGALWIINASYYSMFYLARALIEKQGIKIKTERSVHAITFDILVHHFYMTGKLEKRFIEDYAKSEEETAETLGRKKAKELIEDYYNEKDKRAEFTYEMGKTAMQNKAKTSLNRAKQFNEEIRSMI